MQTIRCKLTGPFYSSMFVIQRANSVSRASRRLCKCFRSPSRVLSSFMVEYPLIFVVEDVSLPHTKWGSSIPHCHIASLAVYLMWRVVVQGLCGSQFNCSHMCYSDLEGAFAIFMWWRVEPNLDRVYSQPLPRVTTPSSCLAARPLEVYLLSLHQYAASTRHHQTKPAVDDRFFVQ